MKLQSKTSSARSMQQVHTYRSDHTSAYLKHLIYDCEQICNVREMLRTDSLTTDKLVEALNTLPNVAKQSNLYPYVSEMRNYLSTQLCTAYASEAAEKENYSVAEAAASTLGDDHPLKNRYMKLRMTTLQPEMTFDEWLFSITVPEDLDLTTSVVSTPEIAHFDNLDTSPCDQE